MSKKILSSELKKFRDYLQKKKLKFTLERHKILEKVFTINCHFQAEDLLVHMRKNGLSASKATIYRTLPLLVKSGVICEANVGEKQVHYECAYGRYFHDHLVCQNCRQIIEFQEPEIKNLINKICQKHDLPIGL